MFRVGPHLADPLPEGSIILCYYCEELVGFALCRIFWSMDMDKHYIHFCADSHYWDGVCPHCNHQFADNGMVKYFPTDNPMGRIMLFFANAPTVLRRTT